MFKKIFVSSLFVANLTFFNISAEIIETRQIEDLLPAVKQESLVLFNIAEVLTDSQLSLGSSPWRAYIKAKTTHLNSQFGFNIHDALTWLIINKVPHKSVETATPQLIKDLQEREIAVAAFTSRGRSEWYSTQLPGVDDVTESLLSSLSINFIRSNLPFVFIQVEGSPFLSHFRNGIFYSEHMEKGAFLKQLLEDSGHHPESVIFVDDKRDSLVTVEAALAEMNIPFTGYWYTRTKQDHQDFSPMVANVQLEALIKEGIILSDEEAQKIIEINYPDVDPDSFFLDLLDQIDFSFFPPQD